MDRIIINRIFNELTEKESNSNNTDKYIGYSDILGEYITDSFLSISNRIRNNFIDYYLDIDY